MRNGLCIERAKRRVRVGSSARVLLVSDTHGSVDQRIVDVARTCHAVVHAGDVGSVDVLKALLPSKGEVYAVRGNNDTPEKWCASEQAALKRLPHELTLELPGGSLVVTHGDRVQPAAMRVRRLRERYPKVRAVVYGHTHRLLNDCSTRPWVLNPGAGGASRTFGGPSCILLFATTRRWRICVLQFSIISRGKG